MDIRYLLSNWVVLFLLEKMMKSKLLGGLRPCCKHNRGTTNVYECLQYISWNTDDDLQMQHHFQNLRKKPRGRNPPPHWAGVSAALRYCKEHEVGGRDRPSRRKRKEIFIETTLSLETERFELIQYHFYTTLMLHAYWRWMSVIGKQNGCKYLNITFLYRRLQNQHL